MVWVVCGWLGKLAAGLWIVCGWFGWFVGSLAGVWVFWQICGWFRVLELTNFNKCKETVFSSKLFLAFQQLFDVKIFQTSNYLRWKYEKKDIS